jgi:hypothetical protein
MLPQVTLLGSMPTATLLQSVKNPTKYYPNVRVIDWLKTRYNGNKPKGGLWTSTHTHDDVYASDWVRGLHTNKVLRMASPINPNHKPWLLTPSADAKILTIHSISDATAFTAKYRLATVPVPDTLRQGMGVLITAEITDWEHALTDWDGIRLTANACDEVLYAMMHKTADTSFSTWNAESTFWGKWKFDSVTQFD